MAIEITMPRLSDTMEEGTLIKWNVKVGDTVSAGDHLADVETDKATMELQAFDDGTVAAIGIEEGETVDVGSAILVLAEEGEDVEEAAKALGSGGAKEPKDDAAEVKAVERKDEENEAADVNPPADGLTSAATGGGGRVRVSPLARKLAEEHDLDVANIQGSGPDGRIIKRDVLQAAAPGSKGGTEAKPSEVKPSGGTSGGGGGGAKPQATPSETGLEHKRIPLSGMRKTIAKRLIESKTTIPHFQVSMKIDVDPLLTLRGQLNDQLESQGIKLSVNDFVSRAAALACVQHPVVNSSWDTDAIVQHGTVNLGFAVALATEKGGGLVVPVIRDAQTKGLRQLNAETKKLAKKARDAGLSPQEMSDGTFTISNLGMYGVDQFNAIVNPPQAAILAIGGAIEQPVVRDGQLAVGRLMNATLSGDHRVLDGVVAAEFLQTFKDLMESPAALLV